MSIHYIFFCGEIRKILILFVVNKIFSVQHFEVFFFFFFFFLRKQGLTFHAI